MQWTLPNNDRIVPSRLAPRHATRTDDPTQNQQVLSPPTPHRTNTSNDTHTPPEQSKDESKEEGMIADLSPITKEEEKKQPWHADLPYPSMEPPKHLLNHCTGLLYDRNAGGKIYWRSRFPVIAIENLPLNLKFVASHWTGRILPDGTTFLGRTPDGSPVFGPPTNVDHTRKRQRRWKKRKRQRWQRRPSKQQ
jgi:hypothetical protein